MADEPNTTTPSDNNHTTPLDAKHRKRLDVLLSDMGGDLRRLEARIEALGCLADAMGRDQALAVKRLESEADFYWRSTSLRREQAIAALNQREGPDRHLFWDLDD
jgi:hypothetical protein